METWRLDSPSEAEHAIRAPTLTKQEQALAAALARLKQAHPKKGLEELLQHACSKHRFFVPKKSAQRIVEMVTRETSGLGLFDYLLHDNTIEEIAIPAPGQVVFVYKRGDSWKRTNLVLNNAEAGIELANKMARQAGRRLTLHEPRLSATLPDGSRLHAAIAPLAPAGFELSLRKFRGTPYSPSELIASHTLSARAAAFLWLTMQTDASILVAGNTGSGKTTTLNALFSFVPMQDRIVVTEETPELKLPQEHVARLVARPELGITLQSLVKDTLRMRPDRVVIGEVRDADEVKALFDALLAGQARGTYATFHANNSIEALQRMRALGANGQDLNALRLLIIQRRITALNPETGSFREKRRVTEIAEIIEGRPRPIFKLNTQSDLLEEVNAPNLEEAALSLGLQRFAIGKELAKRAELLYQLSKRGVTFGHFLQVVQNHAAPLSK